MGDFAPEDMSAIARLAERWGTPWLLALLRSGAQPATQWRRTGLLPEDEDDAIPLPKPLATFVQAGQRAGLAAALIVDMLDQCQAAVTVVDVALAQQTPALRHARLQGRLQSLSGLVQALRLSPQAGRQPSELLRHVQAHPDLYPLRSLRPLVQALPSGASMPAEVPALRAAVIKSLQHALAVPEPHHDDHSLDGIEWVCRCADCSTVIRWATSSSPQPLTLAIAEARRRHVQSLLQDADAPVGIETLKQGSPYKLVISEPVALRDSRHALRQTWADELAAVETGAI